MMMRRRASSVVEVCDVLSFVLPSIVELAIKNCCWWVSLCKNAESILRSCASVDKTARSQGLTAAVAKLWRDGSMVAEMGAEMNITQSLNTS